MALCLFAGVSAHANDVVHDTFLPDLQRSIWFELESPSQEWVVEKQLRFAMDKIYVRPIAGGDKVHSLEVIDAATNQVVWSTTRFERITVSPALPAPSDYIFRCKGAPSDKDITVAIIGYQNNRPMPTWRLDNVDATYPSESGMLLKQLDPDKPGHFSGRMIGIAPGKFYEVELNFVSTQDTELTLHYTQRNNEGRKVGSSIFQASGGVEHTWKVRFPAIASSVAVSVRFSGESLFKSLTLRETGPPEQVHVSGEKTFYYEPRNREPDPAVNPVTKPVVYQRNPRMMYEDSIPQDFEIIDQLDTFAAKGDYAVYWFAIHNPNQERQIDLLQLSDLSNGEHTLSADAFNISQVEFRNYPRSPYNYYRIPEIIRPQESATLQPDTNRLFWIQTRLPEDAAPGVYTGIATVTCGTTQIQLPVRLRILPFALLTPDDMVWSAYSRLHVLPQRNYPMELKVRYLQDMKNYGITSLHYSGGGEQSIRQIQEARRQAGMDGPLIIYGSRVEQIAMQQAGIDNNTERWFEIPQVREGFVAQIRQMDSWIKQYGAEGYDQWYYMGVDEPHIGRMDLSLWQNRLARQAGVHTAACVYGPRYVAQLAPYLSVSCNSFIAENAKTHDELTKIQSDSENLNYWYLGAGCYTGQEGGLMPNRLLSGMMCYKLGVKGHLSYTYQAYGDDPYDNFARKSYAMTYPHPNPTLEKVSVFTLQWEGVREGITDYKYLYTLESTIKAARAKGLTDQADEAQAVLDRIVSSIPYLDDARTANGITDPRTLDNATAQSLRRLAAHAILQLHHAGVSNN